MRGKVAKAFRKAVYGDGSKRNQGLYEKMADGHIESRGPRWVYQRLKRAEKGKE